jgi:hypothetical protein
MVQDQLVEYVSSQIKLGISRDAVKSALVGVGWAPLDVEDTLKKVEGGVVSAPVQSVASPKTMDAVSGVPATPKFVSFSMPGTAAGQMKNPEPQSIRVSDLVSAIAPASSMSVGAAPKSPSFVTAGIGKMTTTAKDQFPKGSPAGVFPTFTALTEKKKMKFGLLEIVAVVLIVALGAFAGYLFVKNSTLTNELRTAQVGTGQQNQAAAQSSPAQIQALNVSNTALTAEIASLTAENQNISANLSLLAAPLGLSSSTAPLLTSISGTLSAGLGKNTYIVTTQYGVKVNIKNSSDATLAALLVPLLGKTVQISGTYIPGTPSIVVTIVNGSPISLQPAATSTAATSTAATSTAAIPAMP